MSTGLSIWWATPSDPARHFSAAELALSDRYHRPIRRVGLWSTATKVALLVGATWLAAGPLSGSAMDAAAGSATDAAAAGGGAATDWPAGVGFVAVLTSRSLLVGAGLVALALRVPAIAADAWFEYRFRHGAESTDDFRPVPVNRFAATVGLLLVLIWSGLVVMGAAVYTLAAATGAWPVVLSAVAVTIVVIAAVVEWPVRRRLPGRAQPLAPRPAGLDRLAERFGLADVPVLAGSPGSASTPVARHHFNAASMGLGRNRRVVVSDGLLAEPRPIQDFVVAHEFSHLRRHHLVGQTALVAMAAVASIAALAAATTVDGLEASLGVELMQPLHLPAVVLLLFVIGAPVGAAAAWIGRAQERAADADAIAAVGPLPVGPARGLYAQANTDLAPPWWVRLFAQHPAPAERLEFVERHRRAI